MENDIKEIKENLNKSLILESEFQNLSETRKTGVKTVYAAMIILKVAGGQMRGSDVISRIEENLDLSDFEKGSYEKTGYIRWVSILRFYSIDCSKAGFLKKSKGIWYLTQDGEEAMKLGPIGFLTKASSEYTKWHSEQKKNEIEEINEGIVPDIDQAQKATLEELEEQALTGLRQYLINKNPYEFQDMVAALLRAMGYYTPFISPKGKDGGIDVIAYQDPLGAKSPRIKVQVKHKPDSNVPLSEIHSLTGLLNKDGDIGLFVTSGGFTSDSEKFARDSHIHVKLIDFEDFITLWQQFYDKLTDEEKNWLPLHPIYFLGSNE
jgi:restriction system protein